MTALMTAQAAEWIRRNAWPKWLLREFTASPAYYLTCACQFGTTTQCEHGGRRGHAKCHRATPQEHHETWILSRYGTVLFLREPYKHPTPTITGLRHVRDTMVWLTRHRCRWICPCACHTSPTIPTAQPEPERLDPIPVPGGIQDTIPGFDMMEGIQ
ncbi:hypothetical protein AB0C10_15990 [Microbispora amethystogenes]|uniref:hypothetical protein n=1 Tax=Microbispora amethystogenes TaxID=1427754 RepID=UPI0033F6A38E